MRISELHVAGQDAASTMTLSQFAGAIIGGMKIHEVAVFTTKEEAEAHVHRGEVMGRAMEALRQLPTEVIERLAESIRNDGSSISLLIEAGREQSVLEAMEKCGL